MADTSSSTKPSDAHASSPASSASAGAGAGAGAGAAAKKPPPVYSHFFRMIGMPNFRFRLPSRNWMIFLTIVGSWYGAYWYDRREKKRIIQKWCDRVSHLATQPFPPTMMPRNVTVILSAPPADGLLTAREHFHEYVKPVLVAGGMDWDAIEGRKEGDVRAMVAERIRETRMRAGEPGEVPERDEGEENKEVVRESRIRNGIESENGATCGGDIVIGRNTWKEYVRGVHEGWLGPLYPPKVPEEEVQQSEAPKEDVKAVDPPTEEAKSPVIETLEETLGQSDESDESQASEASQTSQDGEKKEETEEKKEESKPEKGKRKQPPAFISTADYSLSSLPATLPQRLGPSATVPHPHILGFLNTPIRMYRFLRQRHLADEIGRQVASAVLAAHTPYQQHNVDFDTDSAASNSESAAASSLQWEQEAVLKSEESEWHKSVRKTAEKDKEEGKESVWVDAMIMDSRIASRMSKFVPSSDEGDAPLE